MSTEAPPTEPDQAELHRPANDNGRAVDKKTLPEKKAGERHHGKSFAEFVRQFVVRLKRMIFVMLAGVDIVPTSTTLPKGPSGSPSWMKGKEMVLAMADGAKRPLRPTMIVLGAGIKGAFDICAFAADFDVTGIDPSPAAGTTGKSDGRLHSGGTGLSYDPFDILERKLRGGTTMGVLFPAFLETRAPAVYGYTDETDVERLIVQGGLAGISIQRTDPPRNIRGWFGPDVTKFYSFQEFGFDPAALTGALLDLARERGAKLIKVAVIGVNRHDSGRWEVKLANGDSVFGDIVINALGSGIRDVPVEGGLHLPPGIEVLSWPIGAVQANRVPHLDRVLVSADHLTRMASIVKHGSVLAVDTKPYEFKAIQSPRELPRPNPRPYNPDVFVERYMVDELRKRFRPLAKLWDADFQVIWCSHIRTQPAPEAPHRTQSDIISIKEVLPGYFIHLGGMATTCAIDVIDIVKVVRQAVGMDPLKPFDVLLPFFKATPSLEKDALKVLYKLTTEDLAASPQPTNDNQSLVEIMDVGGK